METIKTYLKIGLLKAFILSLAAFYGTLVAIRLVYFRIKLGAGFFTVKERTLPPACLQDPAFKHSYVNLKVSSIPEYFKRGFLVGIWKFSQLPQVNQIFSKLIKML